jgi:hypothetical protein
VVKYVLSSLHTYFLLVHKMPKWGFSRIDKFCRSFLWRGEDPDKVKGGHCLVNWRTCTRPRKLGGLGIKDLDKINRALRLKWLWHHWDVKEKPEKNLLKITDPMDRYLFFNSTWIPIGNGKTTPFWEARWLSGQSLKELTPNLYSITRFKRRSVALKMYNDNWIRNLQHVSNPIQLEEFTLLFMEISDVQLNDQHDSIYWKWTTDKKNSVASAYNCHFLGSMDSPCASDIWSSYMEHKCNFFAWLVI